MINFSLSELNRFIFNGLKGPDLIIFNLLRSTENQVELSGYQIAQITCYHHDTVYDSLARLEQLELIERHREKLGQRYSYTVKPL